MSKPRRLGPCPCGSGKRYKHCQGVLELEGIALGSFHKDMPTVEQFRKMVKAVDESSANRLRQRALFGETGLSNSVEFGGRRRRHHLRDRPEVRTYQLHGQLP